MTVRDSFVVKMLGTKAGTSTEGVQRYSARIKAVAVQWRKNDEATVDNKK